ncbi:MAG: hypothetical protein ABSC95_31515 [Acetobacteraceae bacterium]|jgi:hypothetical protein
MFHLVRRSAWALFAVAMCLVSVGIIRWVTYHKLDVADVSEIALTLLVSNGMPAGETPHAEFKVADKQLILQLDVDARSGGKIGIYASHLIKQSCAQHVSNPPPPLPTGSSAEVTVANSFFLKSTPDAAMDNAAAQDNRVRNWQYIDAGSTSHTDESGKTILATYPLTYAVADILPPGLSGTNGKDPKYVNIDCHFELSPFQATYAGRQLSIRTIGGATNPASVTIEPLGNVVFHESPYMVDFSSLDSEEGFRLSGGSPEQVDFPDVQRMLKPGWGRPIHVLWRDTDYSDWRDITLIAVGALLGLAAAAFLESIRPTFERQSDGPPPGRPTEPSAGTRQDHSDDPPVQASAQPLTPTH